MRSMFAVGAKLLGIFLTYRGVYYLFSVLGFGRDSTVAIIVQSLAAAIAFGFAFVLVFRTDWLARLVGAGSEARASVDGFDPRAALRAGIVLIGLYVFVSRIGVALSSVSFYFTSTPLGNTRIVLARFLAEVVPIALALFFILRADRVVGLVSRERSHLV